MLCGYVDTYIDIYTCDILYTYIYIHRLRSFCTRIHTYIHIQTLTHTHIQSETHTHTPFYTHTHPSLHPHTHPSQHARIRTFFTLTFQIFPPWLPPLVISSSFPLFYLLSFLLYITSSFDILPSFPPPPVTSAATEAKPRMTSFSDELNLT